MLWRCWMKPMSRWMKANSITKKLWPKLKKINAH